MTHDWREKKQCVKALRGNCGAFCHACDDFPSFFFSSSIFKRESSWPTDNKGSYICFSQPQVTIGITKKLSPSLNAAFILSLQLTFKLRKNKQNTDFIFSFFLGMNYLLLPCSSTFNIVSYILIAIFF